MKEKMSKILKELSVITGTYKNSKGEQKNRYTRIGSIIDTKNGDMLKIDVTPVMDGGWNGWAYINDPRPKDDNRSNNNDSDDIQF